MPIFQRILDLHPYDAEVRFQLAVSLRKTGRQSDSQDAVEHLERAVTLDPAHRGARLELAVAYLEAGRVDRTITLVNQLLREQQNDRLALSLRARAWLAAK